MVDRLFKEDQTSVLDAWIAGVEDVPNGWVAARWTWAGGKRGVGEGDARGREPGALIEGIHPQAHKELDIGRNPELPRAGAVAGREENLILDQCAAAMRTAPNDVAFRVDYGDDEGSNI